MKKMIMLSCLFLSFQALAQNIGVSTHPYALKSKVMNTEVANNFSNGSGTGVNVRYFQRINDDVNFDAGMGVNSGERENRFFMGSDYRLFPDYGNQPRISIKGLYSYSSEFDNSVHRVGLAPTLSKGLSVSGNEIFPFISVPLQLELNSDTNNYRTVNSLAVGVTGRIPVDGYENLVANLETQFNLRSSFNAITLGISLPIN